MALHFILGRAGTGKTHACLEGIRQQLRQQPQGPPLIFLVPEQATFLNEMALLKGLESHGSIRAEVLSFQRLYQRYGEPEGKVWLDPIGKTMLVAKSLNSCRTGLRLFNAGASREGFIPMVLQAMEELARYDIGPAALEDAATYFTDQQPESVIARKLQDLSMIYQTYGEGFAQQYTEATACLQELALAIPQIQELKGATVWIDGFISFTPVQLKVIGALLLQVRDVYVALCMPPELALQPCGEEDLFYLLWRTRQQLADVAYRLQIPLGKTIALTEQHRFEQEELNLLEQRFAGLPIVPEGGPCQHITLVEAASKRAEVAWVGRQILQLAREKGYRFREMGVVLRSIGDYEDLIRQVFEELGIPVFLDSPRPTIFHPLVEFLRSALEVATEGWQQAPVFRYLKSGLAPLSQDEVNQLENYCLAFGIRDRHWRQAEPWTYVSGNLSEQEKKDYLLSINAIRYRAGQALAAFCDQAANASQAGHLVDALEDLLAQVHVEDVLEQWAIQAEAEGRLDLRGEHLQVQTDVQSLLQQCRAFLGEEPMTVSAFAEIMDSGFQTLSAKLIPPALDEVFVGDLQFSRSPALKVCFVIGVNDKVLPKAVNDTGFFSESEREALQKAGWQLPPGSKEKQIGESYLVYTALTRASQQLYVSYALGAEDGAGMLPSAVIRQLKSCYPQLPKVLATRQPEGAVEESYFGARYDTLSHLARLLRQAKEGKKIDLAWWQAYDWFARQPQWQQSLQRLCRGIAWQPDQQPLPADLVPQVYQHTKISSISRLEAFNRCPCRYFARYGLNLKPPRQFVLARLDMGSVYHGLLAEASQRINASYRWDQLSEAILDQVLQQALDTMADWEIMELLRSSSHYLYALQQAVAVVKATLQAMGEQAKLGSFRPVAFEVGFGPQESWRGWQIALPTGGNVVLEGRIDRIDIARQPEGEDDRFWIRIVDFKSGQRDLDQDEVAQGVTLQLPVYLKVALDNATKLASGRAQPAGMFYMAVRDGIKKEDDPYLGPGDIRLRGTAVLDPDSIELAEHGLTGKAKTLPVKVKKDGSLSSTQGLKPEEVEALNQQIAQVVATTVERINAGQIAALPWRSTDGKECACDHCDYAPLCALDRIEGGENA